MPPTTRKKVELSDPTAEIVPSSGGGGSPILFYALLGSVGLSLGATFFLFREVRRLSEMASANKRQQEATAKNLQELSESLRELSDHIATQFAGEGLPPPPKIEEALPRPEGSGRRPKVSEGGPRDEPKKKSVATQVPTQVPTPVPEEPEEEVVETDSSCDEDGVCRVVK